MTVPVLKDFCYSTCIMGNLRFQHLDGEWIFQIEKQEHFSSNKQSLYIILMIF